MNPDATTTWAILLAGMLNAEDEAEAEVCSQADTTSDGAERAQPASGLWRAQRRVGEGFAPSPRQISCS